MMAGYHSWPKTPRPCPKGGNRTGGVTQCANLLHHRLVHIATPVSRFEIRYNRFRRLQVCIGQFPLFRRRFPQDKIVGEIGVIKLVQGVEIGNDILAPLDQLLSRLGRAVHGKGGAIP